MTVSKDPRLTPVDPNPTRLRSLAARRTTLVGAKQF